LRQIRKDAVIRSDDRVRQLSFAILQLENPLFDRIRSNEAIREHGSRLPDAVRAIDACASTAGFHHGSSRNTYSAAVRFKPNPPARRLMRNRSHALSF